MRSLGAIALVCTGIIVLAGAVGPLQWALMLSFGSFEPFDFEPGLLDLILLWLPVAAAVALALWLITRRHALAARWFGDTPAEITLAPQTLLRLALLILGVVLLVLAVPGLLGVFAENLAARWEGAADDPSYSLLWPNTLLSALPWLAQLVLGALLLAYHARLARRLWRPAEEPAPVAEPHA